MWERRVVDLTVLRGVLESIELGNLLLVIVMEVLSWLGAGVYDSSALFSVGYLSKWILESYEVWYGILGFLLLAF